MRKLKIWVCDFETVTPKTKYFEKHNDTCVYLGGYADLDEEQDNVKIFRSLPEFFEMLKLEYRSGICFFHNLNFDGDFIYKYFIQKGVPYLDNHKVRKVGFHIRFVENQIYEIIYNFKSNTNRKNFFHKIHFKCSWRFLSNSIENLGKNYGIKKIEEGDDENFYNNEPGDELSERFIQYLKNDIIILKKSLLDFEKGLASIKYTDTMKKWYNILTIGSLSYKIQKSYIYQYSKEIFGDKRIFEGIKLDAVDLLLADKFYYGGWTHFNQKIQYQSYQCKNIGLAIDINSAHPSSMQKLLPFGPIYKKEKYEKRSEHKLIYYHLKIRKATAKSLEVLTLKNWKIKEKLSLNINGRYSVLLENFECYYLKEEFELLKEFYDFEGVKILNEYWCNAEYFLKDYISDIYKLKVDNAKNSFGQTYKILLNSGYGKHAQRKDYDGYILIKKSEYNNEKDYILNDIVYDIVSVEPLLKGVIDDMLVLTLRKMELNDYGPNKLIAATICSYTRILLWKEILHFGLENFLYGDTDSLRLDITKEVYENSKHRFHDTRIGAFAIENFFNRIEISGAKRYRILDDKKTIKYAFGGINKKYLKSILDENIEVFTKPEQVYVNGKLSLKRCKSGSILQCADLKVNRLRI